MTICLFLRKYLARNLLYLRFMLMNIIKTPEELMRYCHFLQNKYLKNIMLSLHTKFSKLILYKNKISYDIQFCKIVDVNKCHFRIRVNDEELIGPEVPHFSSNGDKYIIGLLFVVNIS
jgi:hypothetical protein